MKGIFKKICSALCAAALIASSISAGFVSAQDVDYSKDYKQIIANWEETIIGNAKDFADIDYSSLDENNPIEKKIITLTESTRNYLNNMAKPEGGFSNGDEAINYWNNLIYPGQSSHIWNTNAEEGMPVHELSGYIWEDIAPAPQASRSQFAQVTSAVNRIQEMAKAYRIGNFTAEEKLNLKNYILWTTEFICEEWYALDTVRYGNWHDWNVGIPLALNNILVLLYDEANSYTVNQEGTTLTQLVLTCIDHFPPTHTMLGANLNWRSTINLIRGALAGSIDLVFGTTEGYQTIQSGMQGFEKVATYVTSEDGFYDSDGSYVQHHMYAYTGSYGAHLIDLMSQSILTVSGTSFEVTEESEVNNMYLNAFKAYEPVLVNGQVMELVYGRSVCAAGSTGGYAGGKMIISGIARLALAAEKSNREDAYKLKLLAKAMLKEATSDEVSKYYSYYKNSDLAVIFEALKILTDQSINLEDYKRAVNTNIFYNMDRVVQHNSNYSVGLSIHSKRISAYESINGNNTRGWFQGSGMLYTYTDDYSKYADHYWYTINSYRLPGTTVLRGVDALPREEGNTNAKGQNSFSGGVSLGDYATAGMFLHPVNQTLNAKKSWFMFDNEIVALGTGITANEGSTIETTIENIKLLDDNSNIFTVDGETVTIDANGDGLLDTAINATDDGTLNHNTVNKTINKYAHISGNTSGSAMGYYFPQGADINVVREARTGNNYQINPGSTADDKTPYTKNYLTMYYDHGANGADNNSYSYVILPDVSLEETKTYSENADIKILANNNDVQAVLHNDGVVGANFWNNKEATVQKDGKDYITATAPCSVMIKETENEITVSVSDPTQENTEKFFIEINIGDKSAKILKSNEDIRVISAKGKLILEVNPVSVAGRKGETKTATFTLGNEAEEIEYAEPNITEKTFFTKEGKDAYFSLGYTGSYPATFTLSTAEGIDASVLDYIKADRFGKLYVNKGISLGRYPLSLTVSNTDTNGNTVSHTYDIIVGILTPIESKDPSKSVVYYDFNEGYGTTAKSVSKIKSSSSQDFTGDLSEGVEWVDGFVGTALKFNSIEDTLINDGGTGTNANSLGMQPNQSVFGGGTEYDFWVKFDVDPTTRNTDQWIISKGGSTATSNIPWAIKITNTGKIAFIWNANGGTSSNWKYSDALDWNTNEWYHINITHDSSFNVTFKRDDIAVGSGKTNTGVTAINRVVSINSGNYLTANTSQYFDGTIDELYFGGIGGGEEIRLRSKVSFNTADGSAIAPQYPYLGETVTIPEKPTRDGYIFLGWTDKDGNPFDFESKINTDITVFANWADNDSEYTSKITNNITTSVKNQTVLYYDFDDGYGTSVANYGRTFSTGDYTGIISSSTEWTDGFIGSALKFDSYSDWLKLTKVAGHKEYIGMNPASTTTGSGGKEYDFWIKFNDNLSDWTADQLIMGRDGNNIIPWAIKVTVDGKLAFNYGGIWIYSDILNWNANEWYHINITHLEDYTATLYRDGSKVGSGTTGNVITISRSMYINGYDCITSLKQSSTVFTDKNQYFNGTIDELYLGKAGNAEKYINVRNKVTFNTDSGSYAAPCYVWDGDILTEPLTPTKENYNFGGWYTDKECTIPYDFSSAVTKDITLYAKWNTPAILGDANLDGKIDSVDLTLLRQYLLGTLETEIADINQFDLHNDGKINLKDLVAYKKYLVVKK